MYSTVQKSQKVNRFIKKKRKEAIYVQTYTYKQRKSNKLST